MKKETLHLALVGLTASVMFLLNPIQTTEIDAKITNLCLSHPDKPCDEIRDYCIESLKQGQECYIINQK